MENGFIDDDIQEFVINKDINKDNIYRSSNNESDLAASSFSLMSSSTFLRNDDEKVTMKLFIWDIKGTINIYSFPITIDIYENDQYNDLELRIRKCINIDSKQRYAFFVLFVFLFLLLGSF